MFKLTVALPPTFVQRLPLIFWKRMQSQLKTWRKMTSPTHQKPFFCWRLLGLIPGGAPLSQLSSGVKYAIFVSTIGGMSFCDKNMQKGRMIKHIMGINKHHPQSVPGLQKRAPVMSKRQPLCQRGGNSTSRDGFGETKRKHPCQSQCASHRVADITYSPETTNAFQELLTLIDENTKEVSLQLTTPP